MLTTTKAGHQPKLATLRISRGPWRQRGGSLGEDFTREIHPARHRARSGRRLCLTGRLRRRRQQRRLRRWKVRRWELRWRQLRRWGLRWRRLGRWLEGIVRRRCQGGWGGYSE